MIESSFRMLIEHDFEGFGTFAKSVALAFPPKKYGYVSLLSPCLNDSNHIVPISHEGEQIGASVALAKIAKEASYFERFSVNERTLYVAIRDGFDSKNRILLNKLLRAAMIRLWGEQQALIRAEIIKQTVRSRDMNSFLHRVVHAISGQFIEADEISVFTEDTIRNSLSLSATTRRVIGIQKKDVYYMFDDHSPITTRFINGNTVANDNGLKIPSETLDEYLFRGKIHTRLIIPIQLPDNYLPDRPSPLGVLRLSNFRYNGKAIKKYRLTDYDLIISDFISEVIFVLIQKYQQYQEHEQEVGHF